MTPHGFDSDIIAWRIKVQVLYIRLRKEKYDSTVNDLKDGQCYVSLTSCRTLYMYETKPRNEWRR